MKYTCFIKPDNFYNDIQSVLVALCNEADAKGTYLPKEKTLCKIGTYFKNKNNEKYVTYCNKEFNKINDEYVEKENDRQEKIRQKKMKSALNKSIFPFILGILVMAGCIIFSFVISFGSVI